MPKLGTAASTDFGTRDNRYQPGIFKGHDVSQDFLLGRGGHDITRFADAFGSDLSGLDPRTRQQAIAARAEGSRLIESARITQETEARREERLGMLNEEQDRASVETLSQETIDQMFGSAADDATRDTEALMRSLRSHLGQSGVRGGAAAGMAAGIEMSRLGQLTDARRDLTVYKAQADATDRINRWSRAFQIGEVIGEEPSAFLADALQSVQEAALFREGLILQEDASIRAADAAREAGKDARDGAYVGAAVDLFSLPFRG